MLALQDPIYIIFLRGHLLFSLKNEAHGYVVNVLLGF